MFFCVFIFKLHRAHCCFKKPAGDYVNHLLAAAVSIYKSIHYFIIVAVVVFIHLNPSCIYSMPCKDLNLNILFGFVVHRPRRIIWTERFYLSAVHFFLFSFNVHYKCVNLLLGTAARKIMMLKVNLYSCNVVFGRMYVVFICVFMWVHTYLFVGKREDGRYRCNLNKVYPKIFQKKYFENPTQNQAQKHVPKCGKIVWSNPKDQDFVLRISNL